MGIGKALEADGESNVAGAHDVLDLEIGELGVEAELLDDAGIFAGSKLGVVLRLCAGDHHLARGKNECSSLGLSDTHDDSSESLEK